MNVKPAILYMDAAGQYRWTRHDEHNGNIIGASTEGYHNKSEAEANYYTINGEDAPKLYYET